MRILLALSRRLQTVEAWAAGLFLTGLTLTCSLQVLTRFVLHIPIPWLEEASRFLLIWMTFSAAPALTAQRKNISIDMLPGILKDRFHFNAGIAIDLVIAVCWVCFGFYSLRLITKALVSKQFSVMMNIPFSLVYSILLIAAILATFHILCNIFAAVTKTEEV